MAHSKSPELMTTARPRVLQANFIGSQPHLPVAFSASSSAQARMPGTSTIQAPNSVAGQARAAMLPETCSWGMRSTGAQQGTVVQRFGGGEAFQLPAHLANFERTVGQPLPDPVLQKMESFFRTSFADVRVHVGQQASSIGALAFTSGSNIFFSPGQYNPNSSPGQQLLGHELTHVVQQRAGRVRNPFGSGLAVVQDRAMEAEAERMGRQAASHQATVQPRLASPSRGQSTHPFVHGTSEGGKPAQAKMESATNSRATVPPVVQGRVVGQAVAQARFWEATPSGKPVWHWGPVVSRWWRKSISLDSGQQEMKDGYGVWLRKSAWAPVRVSRPTLQPNIRSRNTLRVGRRTAFFSNSPATHAVFELNDTVWGLAGDFNAVGLAKDTANRNSITWVRQVLDLNDYEANLFWGTAKLAADSLSYDLLSQNCYTPVTAGLVKLRREHLASRQNDRLEAMADELGGDNFGRGTVSRNTDDVYIKIVKKNE